MPSVSVTVEPEIATPLTVFETGGPPAVIVTAKALVAGTEPALSGSSNWSVNVVPETAASRSDGAVTSSVAVCAKLATRFANESWRGFGPGWVKLRGSQGFRDPDGHTWKLDRLHKDHWDVSDAKGDKVREVRFDGSQLWPGGAKNRNKKR